jgi:hypothetical protein
MKKINLQFMFSLALILFGMFSLNAQNGAIKGIVLNAEASKYFQAAGYKFLKIEGDGTTRPSEGYKMILNRKDGSVLISKHTNSRPGEKRQILLRGGADFFCTGCEEETCVIEKVKKGIGSTKNAIQYDCLGCYKADGSVELCSGSLIIRKLIYKSILK